MHTHWKGAAGPNFLWPGLRFFATIPTMPDDRPATAAPGGEYPLRSPREILARHGYIPLAPGELDARQLPGRLWELLYAAAAQRFFFWGTDHLDDRSLYAVLWEKWLDQPTADFPPEAEINTHTMVAEYDACGMTSEEIWLRYYAGQSDQELWRSTQPGFVFPLHEDPPFNRDRFLPMPPIPLDAQAGWLPGDDAPPETPDPDHDPLGLNAVDREIAAAKNEFRPEANPPFDPPNPGIETRQLALEPEMWTPPAQQLVEQNIPLLPPPEITDEALAPILWELLHNLALRGFYVLHTDHLGDRELYAGLWERGLRDPAFLPGRNPRAGWFHDLLGSGGEPEVQLWLRYYASDAERPGKSRRVIVTGGCPRGRSENR